MDNNKIAKAVEEAARLLRENPSWSYKKAIEQAKKIYEVNIDDKNQEHTTIQA